MANTEPKRKTWIVYKANSRNATGWEDRKLIPSGGLTDLLTEAWNWSDQLPQIGDRVREYINLEDPGNGITHGRDSDWVVDEIRQFSSFDTPDRIVVCICSYSPIPAQWEKLEQGAPVHELLNSDS